MSRYNAILVAMIILAVVANHTLSFIIKKKYFKKNYGKKNNKKTNSKRSNAST